MKIIVIGASQGLGLELTKKFLLGGHVVAAGIRRRNAPEALLDLRRQYSDKLLVFPADVTDEGEIREGAERCKDFLQEADALCNAAGVLLPGDRVNPLHLCDIDELRKTFEVNAIGAIIVLKYFYPLIAAGGKFLTVTSEGVGVMNPGDWVPCYALSKTTATKVSGIMNLAVSDVDFYSVHPGRMNTEMGRSTAQIEPEEAALGFYRIITGEIPVSRENWYMDYHGDAMDA